MNNQYFYMRDGKLLTDEQMEEQNEIRRKRNERDGFGWFEADSECVYYHYDETHIFDVATVIGAAKDGNDFDTFVLTADRGTQLVAYIYGIEGLDYTEESFRNTAYNAVGHWLRTGTPQIC